MSELKRPRKAQVAERPLPPIVETSQEMGAPQPMMFQRATMIVGPLPAPELLAQYEQAHPGLAERLIRAFEEESAHRRAGDRSEREQAEKLVDSRIALARRGQLYGLFVVLAGFVVAVLLGYQGHGVSAAVVGSLNLAGLAGLFISVGEKNAQQLPRRGSSKGALPPPPET